MPHGHWKDKLSGTYHALPRSIHSRWEVLWSGSLVTRFVSSAKLTLPCVFWPSQGQRPRRFLFLCEAGNSWGRWWRAHQASTRVLSSSLGPCLSILSLFLNIVEWGKEASSRAQAKQSGFLKDWTAVIWMIPSATEKTPKPQEWQQGSSTVDSLEKQPEVPMTLTWRPVLCSTSSQMPLSPCARSPGEGRAHAQTGFVEDGQQRWGRSWSRVLFPRTSGTGSAAPRPTRHTAGSGIPSFRTKHHWDSILAAPSDCGGQCSCLSTAHSSFIHQEQWRLHYRQTLKMKG